MDDYIIPAPENDDEESDGGPKFGRGGERMILLKAEEAGKDDFELILVRSWEAQDFIERVDTANGEPMQMKNIPNVGYRKVTIEVKE